MSSSGFFMRSSMAQSDPVDFNCTTPQAALLPITVDLAGHRMKTQAQPFAAPVFFERHSQAAVISCVVGDFPVPLSIPIIASPRGHRATLLRPARLALAQGLKANRGGVYLLLARFFLRPVVPSHYHCGKKHSLCVTIA